MKFVAIGLFVSLALASSARAGVTWSYQFDNPFAPLSQTDQVFVPITITNSSSSTSTLDLSNFGAGANYPTQYGASGFGQDQPFPWTNFFKQLDSIRLFPGESASFIFATVYPIDGPVPPGQYTFPAFLSAPGNSGIAATNSFNWTVSGATPGNLFLTGFDALGNSYVSPVSGTSLETLQVSQQSEITTAYSTAQQIADGGTPMGDNVITTLGDLQSLAGVAGKLIDTLAGVAVHIDPETDLLCLGDTCDLSILHGTGYSINDPYEAFDYNLPVEIDSQDASLFKVGDQYFVNEDLFGGKGFSTFDVTSVNGDNVNFVVHDISQISAGVPEPATWSLLLCGTLGVGAMLRRRRVGQLSIARGIVARRPARRRLS